MPPRSLAERPTKGVPEIPEAPLDLLKLGEQSHGVFPIQGLGPRREHGQGSAEVFEFLVAVHGKRTYVPLMPRARGRVS